MLQLVLAPRWDRHRSPATLIAQEPLLLPILGLLRLAKLKKLLLPALRLDPLQLGCLKKGASPLNVSAKLT